MPARRYLLGLTSLLATLGCSRTAPSLDEGGVTTDPGGSSSEDSTGSSEESTESSSGGQKFDVAEDGEDQGMKLDIAPIGDSPSPSCSTMYYESLEMAAAAHPDCEIEPGDHFEYFELCIDRPLDVSCSYLCPDNELCEGMDGVCWFGEWVQLCGPYEDETSCCLLLVEWAPITTG
jgi:hypothetical protein